MAQRKSAHKHILVIEDQLEILDSIGRITEPEDLIVHVIKSLEDYQAFVVQPKVDFSAIILDRHLKFKDSLEVLSQLKRHASWVNIPVLMMAKAFQEEDIAKCLNAGAHVYLGKNQIDKLFLSVINRAIKDYTRYKFYIDKVKNAQIVSLIKKGSFCFKSLKEGHEIADWLATLCTGVRDDIVVGFIELLVNAVEHGNLEIGFEEKSKLLKRGNYIHEVLQRLEDPKFKAREVRVEFNRTPGALEVRIEDEGRGFDYRKYLIRDKQRLFISHGRGIAMAKGLYFDEMKYSRKGNAVVVKVIFDKARNTYGLT